MLARFHQRCLRGSARIIFFGGSISDGASVVDRERDSYRALMTAWLRTRYAGCRLEAINSAVGGTGSDFGLARLERDVLRYRPDLVVIEFAVNDAPSGRRAHGGRT